jgi:Domain of unknown function (DUF5668)
MSTTPNTVGYCRQCGKALDETTVRTSHGTIYCEEHAPMTPTNPQTVPPVEPSPYTNPYTAPSMGTGAPPPIPNNQVSPGLAFMLGMIPGVGAIYNGQYGKGLMHVVTFGLLISILDSSASHGLTPLLAMLLAGFCCYMPFEAYHTALRRQRGLVADEFSSLFPVHGGNKFPVAPIVLIALGVLFLLSNLDILQFDRLLRYWPVMLIALGAYMLFARMSGSGAGSDSSATSGDRQ